MTNKTVNQAIEIVQETLSRFWQRDYKFFLQYLADDIILVGSLQDQFVQGIDNVREILYQTTLQMPPCHLMEQEFLVAQNCGSTCTIVGRYLTTTDDTVDYFVQSQQRCTTVWELVKGQLRMRHVHISDPMGELKLKEGELFAGTIGKMATEYYLRKARNLHDNRRITVKIKGNAVYFLSYAEIMYVSALGRDIEIYTDNGRTITAQMNISDFMRETNGAFVLIHRSYAVYPMYVSRIQQFQVTLSDGTSLPVPAKRYTEVRDMLLTSISPSPAQ